MNTNDLIEGLLHKLKWGVTIVILATIVIGVVKLNVDALMKRKRKSLQKLAESLIIPPLRDDRHTDETHSEGPPPETPESPAYEGKAGRHGRPKRPDR